MTVITILTLIINIFAILVLIFGLFNKFNNPKFKAAYGFWLVGSMILYMLCLSVFIIYNVIFNRDIYLLTLIACLLSPFIIGHFVKYKTLKLYTIIQILCFGVSLFVIFCKYFNV